MIAAWEWLVGSRFGRIVGAILAGLLLILGLRAKWRSDGAKDARADWNRATRKREEEGRDAADQMREDLRGADRDERLRRLRERGL